MPESSQQKTKRTYKKRLLGNNFQHQYSLFYQTKEDALKAIESGITLRRAIAREYREQPFLWRLCKKLVDNEYIEDMEDSPTARVEMVYWTFFTTKKIKLGILVAFVNEKVEPSLNLRNKTVSEESLKKMANTIDRQRPHDLNSFFGLKKVNRLHCANKNQFITL
ncbi:MAG: hypothetical protein COC19_02655 [SAR86 cluster bacterium]|uniref:Uncharacterized protein n=1 Tax=SAR86 cluster bacterium TaxID=2030880 RepID=A0A2A4MRI2_9GAMM|nr:MAG: hypothetical protein COC19_02655 [SAR86 cluster bacterium]